jgi:hypothetical protein
MHVVDAIEGMWAANVPVPQLFDDPLWLRLNEYAFVSGMTDGISKDSAAFGADPSYFFICYYVDSNDVKISICGPSDGVKQFARCLDNAADQVRRLIQISGQA